MANIYQQLVSKYGDDAIEILNKLRSKAKPNVAKEVIEDVKYPKHIVQDSLAESQGFKLQGKPYTTEGVLVPEGTGVPAIRANTLPEATVEVIPNSSGSLQKAQNLLPDIQTTDVTLPSIADDTIVKYAPVKKGLMGHIDDLTAKQKALGAAGLIGAAAAPLFMGGNENSEFESIQQPAIVKKNNQALPQTSEQSKLSSKVQSKSVSGTPAPKTEQPDTTVSSPSSTAKQNDFESQLEAARNQDKENQMLFGLLKAAQMGGSALAGSKADTSYADNQIEDKNKFTTQLKTNMDMIEQDRATQEKNALRDPASDISKQARAMLGSVYPELLAKNPNITAEQLEKMGMNLGNLATAKENIAARKEQAALQRDMMNERRLEKKDLIKNEFTNKHIDTYNKMLYKDYQNLQQAETNANRAKDIIAQNIAGVTPGAGDIAILYNFIKGLDKNSAVREGEIGLSKQARSILGRLDSEVKRISGGDLLDDATRTAFAELIDASAKAERLNFIKQKRNAIASGVEKGIDPEALNRGLFADIPVDQAKAANVLNTPNSTTVSSGTIKIIDTATNRVKTVRADEGTTILKNPRYKEVK
jgi:hypothetical protein